MNTSPVRNLVIIIFISFLCACSIDKLEARLEANPQCKDVVNPKTGALMPCPGSDKSFYKDVGLIPAKSVATANGQTSSSPLAIGATTPDQGSSSVTNTSSASTVKAAPAQTDCKPQIHKKTGGILPCPASD